MLIHEYRGQLIENEREGRISVINLTDNKAKIFKQYNNANDYAYFRSCAKPFQIIPLISRGLDKKFGLNSDEITICCASHRGQQIHIDTLTSIMKKADLKEEDLIMLPSLPIDAQSREKIIKQNGEKRKIYHNCAGKHFALMILQRELTGSIKGYEKLDSKVQQEVIDVIARVCERDKKDIIFGIDGCSVPVFALPLHCLALAYIKLAYPLLETDQTIRNCLTEISKHIKNSPYLISGTKHICGELNTHENFICKGGADGVYAFGLKKEKIGVAFKINDGSHHLFPIIVKEILNQLNALDLKAQNILDSLASNVKKNSADIEIGLIKPVFKLI